MRTSIVVSPRVRSIVAYEGELPSERMAELERNLAQLAQDIGREQRSAADAEAALLKLGAEEETLNRESEAAAAQRAGADERVTLACEMLQVSETTGDGLTREIAAHAVADPQLFAEHVPDEAA